MQILSNNLLTVSVSGHGAELHSIRKGETEYLWQGDPKFWGRHSPVLFPIVGNVWDCCYRVGGKEFQLSQHGFARDMDFTLVSSSDTDVRYRLESTPATLEKYPWPFVLEIAYHIHDNCIDVIWEVFNTGTEEMFFQIGAHPAFNYPDYDQDSAGRGSFTFDRTEGLECIRLKEKGCVDAVTKYPLELPDGRLKLNRDTFDSIDTVILENSQISRVEMFREDGSPWLAVSFDAPVVGLWSPPGKNAPFVCIEPWYGRCDRAGFTGEYKDRDWVNGLKPGEIFSKKYMIEIA